MRKLSKNGGNNKADEEIERNIIFCVCVLLRTDEELATQKYFSRRVLNAASRSAVRIAETGSVKALGATGPSCESISGYHRDTRSERLLHVERGVDARGGHSSCQRSESIKKRTSDEAAKNRILAKGDELRKALSAYTQAFGRHYPIVSKNNYSPRTGDETVLLLGLRLSSAVERRPFERHRTLSASSDS